MPEAELRGRAEEGIGLGHRAHAVAVAVLVAKQVREGDASQIAELVGLFAALPPSGVLPAAIRVTLDDAR